MSQELLASIAGILISLAFSYIPKLKDKYAALSGEYKRLAMLGALLVAALGVMGVSCLDWYILVSCDVAGVKELIEIFILAAIANQSTFLLTPKKP